MKRFSILIPALLMASSLISAPALAGFDLGATQRIELGARTVDTAVSADGRWTFVLTEEGSVHVLTWKGELTQVIKIDSAYNRIEFTGAGNRLILSGGGAEDILVLQLEMIHALDVTGSPARGPEDARVTVAYFGDYQCPYTVGLMPLLDQVLETYPEEVRVVELNYPLNNHPFARPAAAAALAAGKQGKFWEMHGRLFENYRKLDEKVILGLAREAGLDMARFEGDRKSSEVNGLIDRDLAQARIHGVRSTPTVFINGKVLAVRSLAEMSRRIDRELGLEPSASSSAGARISQPDQTVNGECGG